MRLPRAYWYLWAGTLVNRLGYFVGPFLTVYLVGERDLAPTTAGAVVAAFGLGSLVAQPLGGWLADRFGRRLVLVSGMLGTAAAYLALGGVRSLAAIAVCAFIAGVVTDVYRPAVGAMVADMVGSQDRRRAYGLLYWAVNVGVGIASVAGGALAEQHFGLLFVIDAATCLAFAAVIVLNVPETKPQHEPQRDGTASGGALRDPLLILLTVTTFFEAVVYLQYVITLPLVMRDDGLPVSAYGLVAAVNPVVIIATQPLLMRLLRTRSAIQIFAASGVITGIGFGLTSLVHTVAGYAGTVVVWTLGEIASNIAAPVLVAAIAPAHMRGRYQGIWGMAWGLGLFAAPLVGTWTLQSFGSTRLWIGCLLVASASTLALLLVRGALRNRARAISASEGEQAPAEI